ncbi:MAG TPA: hypothetical protein DE312_07290 [Gallionella sp.]|jgi:hypothetical protein|nr:MAG: hypothetical protein A2Z87_00095 [Gallionellales bacterium GWA2_54_124]OGT17956.1 MAG: hypothetical protein A2522_08835 [Gallionellales bacterium RIFOXYD12_FULL_53_10]OGT32408.1 MAG: hypothetical protein A3K00_09310 [Gallionellales bacterium RIFOXYD2_FULL_52_7]HCI53102.1 hypothetical protein [Gallionella sp.]
MIEPASLGNFFTIFFTSAMVIMLGALYALLFAFSRLRGDKRLMPLAYLSYAGLLIAALFLADAANLLKHPFWATIVAFMLGGYLLAPHAIWHLCVGTHGAEQVEPAPLKDF